MAYYGSQQPNRQGQGFYDPHMPGPNWGQGFREMFQNMMQVEQYQKDQARAQKEAEDKQEQARRKAEYEHKKWQREYNLDLRKVEETERRNRALEDKETTPKKYEFQAIYEAALRVYGDTPDGRKKSFELSIGLRPPTPSKPPKPTDYQNKKVDIQSEIDAGRLTPEQGQQAIQGLMGVTPQTPPDELRRKGALERNKNRDQVADIINRIPDYDPGKEKKAIKFLRNAIGTQGGEPPIVEGMRLDMPVRYQEAIFNQRDGVAPPEDILLIQKYDDMFRIFLEDILPRLTQGGKKGFNEFMVKFPELAKDKDIDRVRIKLWIAIYK